MMLYTLSRTALIVLCLMLIAIGAIGWWNTRK